MGEELHNNVGNFLGVSFLIGMHAQLHEMPLKDGPTRYITPETLPLSILPWPEEAQAPLHPYEAVFHLSLVVKPCSCVSLARERTYLFTNMGDRVVAKIPLDKLREGRFNMHAGERGDLEGGS